MREALAYAFDFEWSNKNLFYDAYTRTRSYFDNSELAATGVPQGEELKILEKFRGKIPDEVFTTEYDPPKYDGSGNIRDGLRAALKLLKEAGWSFKDEKLVNDKTGQPFEFEILLDAAANSSASCCRSTRTSSGWGSPPASARSTRRNTKSAWRPSTTIWRSSSFGAVAVARQRAARLSGARRQPTSRAAATCSASRARSSTS